MARLDRLLLEYPFVGARRLRDLLRQECLFGVGRRRIRRLLQQNGHRADLPTGNTSLPHPAHAVYPYLLRELTIDRPNQVWIMDIKYLLSARAQRIPITSGRDGLIQPKDLGLEALEHDACRVLRHRTSRGDR